MSENTASLRVDIVSDVVCPWCIVGFKQLEKAVSQLGGGIEVFWHPFELNPQMPAAGQNLREHVAEKYGATPEASQQAREQLVALGEELGFPFRYGDDSRMYNTFRAHQLIHWSASHGQQHAMKLALFTAFFTNGQNVDDVNVLADCAASIGLNKDEALAVLSDGRFADEVRQSELFWTSRGIQGVPAMVFNQKHLVTGAQGVENYASILQQLMSGELA